MLIGERAHYELAAGHDVKPLIQALEGFSSAGGMLPEQIWDAADLPDKGMFFGRPSGSAMPLVWAHAEYLKLLRSVHDGRVFDRISVVEERYAAATEPRSSEPVEVWSFLRQALTAAAGRRIRLLAEQPFELVWTSDGWATTTHGNSQPVASAGHYADIPTDKQQTGRVEWTFFWPVDHHWEGRNFGVELESSKPM